MAVGVLAERPLVPARQSHAPAFPRHLERENSVTEIMPIDDQTRGTEARADKHHAQRGDAGRILQQHNVGPPDTEKEQAEKLHRLECNPDKRNDAGERSCEPLERAYRAWRQQVAANLGVARDAFRQIAARIPDEIHLRAEIGERARVMLHARAAPEIAEDDDRRVDPAIAVHGSITEYMLKSKTASPSLPPRFLSLKITTRVGGRGRR